MLRERLQNIIRNAYPWPPLSHEMWRDALQDQIVDLTTEGTRAEREQGLEHTAGRRRTQEGLAATSSSTCSSTCYRGVGNVVVPSNKMLLWPPLLRPLPLELNGCLLSITSLLIEQLHAPTERILEIHAALTHDRLQMHRVWKLLTESTRAIDTQLLTPPNEKD